MESTGSSGTTTIHNVPQFLRFNPYILTGYRRKMSVLEACGSLLTWHNESVNVWSHLIPLFFFAYLTWCSETMAPGWMYKICLFSLTCVFAASSAYHLFMPCCSSNRGYLCLVNCDVLSCMLSITVTGMSFIHYGNRCAGTALTMTSTMMLSASAVALVYLVLNTQTKAAGRVKLFGFHCLLRLSLGVVHLWSKVESHGHAQSFYYHVMSFFLLFIGGLINGLRIPERWLGFRWMDYLLNSHNIWHYLCILAALASVLGCLYDQWEFDATTC